MGAVFANASSQYLINSVPPVTTYPFTVGMWCYMTSLVANRAVWSLRSASGSHFFQTSIVGAGPFNFSISVADGGIVNSGTDATALAVNRWYFVVSRFNGTTERRISVLSDDGAATDTFSLVSTNPVGITQSRIGSFGTNYWDGALAEYWMTRSDIQPDNSSLKLATLRQLAKSGPFSIPHIASQVVDYRSFRQAIGSEQDGPDTLRGAFGPQTWVNTNGVALGSHPSLPGTWRGPGDFIRPGIV